jgi:hypothetical protein
MTHAQSGKPAGLRAFPRTTTGGQDTNALSEKFHQAISKKNFDPQPRRTTTPTNTTVDNNGVSSYRLYRLGRGQAYRGYRSPPGCFHRAHPS